MYEEFEETACVTVVILNAYSIRSAMEMVKDVRDGEVEIRFYKDRFVIEEFSQNRTKFCKIVIKKKDLFHYYFDPELAGENEDGCLSVYVNTSHFMTSIKADKKRSTVLEIYRSETDRCAICFSRNRSGMSFDRIIGRYEANFDNTDRIEDPFPDIYSNMEPNCILDEKGLNDNLTSFKNNKQSYTTFSLDESGKITLSSTNSTHVIVTELPFNPNYPPIEIEQDERENTENNYEIAFSHEDVLQLTKMVKLGPYNVIKVYMAIDYPLLFRTKLLNYGTFAIWYTGKTPA